MDHFCLRNRKRHCYLGGFPGPLRKVLGIWAEESDGLYKDDKNYVKISLTGMNCKKYEAINICELIHLESAQILGEYVEDFYAGYPALTVNKFGKGSAYYIAFRNNSTFEKDFYNYLIDTCGIDTILPTPLPEGVSVQTRYDEKNRFIFIMNFTSDEKLINLGKKEYKDVLGNLQKENIRIGGYDSLILKYDNL